MFNLRVEIPSRFHKFENQKCLRPLLREDDRENHSAHSWLVHVFTQPGSKPEKLNASICFPLCPRKRTQVGHPAMSESCQKRKSPCGQLSPSRTYGPPSLGSTCREVSRSH